MWLQIFWRRHPDELAGIGIRGDWERESNASQIVQQDGKVQKIIVLGTNAME